MVRGSYEAMLWLKHYRFKKNFPFFIQTGYNMKIMKQIAETCSDEMISIMNKHIHTYDKLADALSITIGDIQCHLIVLENAKRKFIEQKEREDKVRLQELNSLLEEAEKPKYTPEQEKLRNARAANNYIPLDIVLQQQILDSGNDINTKTGLKWRIYDKIYSNYFVVIDSPVRGNNICYGQHRKLHNFEENERVDFEMYPDCYLSPRELERDAAQNSCIYGIVYELLKKVREDDEIYLSQKAYDARMKKQQMQQPVINREIVIPEFTFPEVEKITELTDQHKKDRNPFNDSGNIF